eukprot:PhF_6_TR32710/c0_g1_i1/m.48278
MSHQTKLPFTTSSASKRSREESDESSSNTPGNNSLLFPQHPHDTMRWGPSGGGQRETMKERIPTLIHPSKLRPPIPGESGRHRDWTERNATTSHVERTDIDPSFTIIKKDETSSSSVPVFKGCIIHINTAAIHPTMSMYHAAKYVERNGGAVLAFPSSRATHYVTSHLCFAKKDLLSGTNVKYVTPEWLVQSIQQGKRLPEAMYRPSASGTEGSADGLNTKPIQSYFTAINKAKK